MATQFRSSYLYSIHLSTRELALALLSWLRQRGLVGVKDGLEFSDTLRNQFLGQVLLHQQTPSLAITSNALYCTVASRFNVNADFSCFNGKMDGIIRITAPPGRTLDNDECTGSNTNGGQEDHPENTVMYLETLNLGIEISQDDLERMLRAKFLPPIQDYPQQVGLSDTLLMVSTAFRRSGDRPPTDGQDAARQRTAIRSLLQHRGSTSSSFFYVTYWAIMTFSRPDNPNMIDHFKRFADYWVEKAFPEDARLLRQLPIFENWRRAGGEYKREAQKQINRLDRIEIQDHETPRAKTRSDLMTDFPCKIGQVVQHRRYGWFGIVVGWRIKHHQLVTDDRIGEGEGPRHHNQVYIDCL